MHPLHNILPKVNQQYSVNQNIIHILKSLVYFSDAENDPPPEIFSKQTGKQSKITLKEIPIITNKLIMKR